MQNHNDHFRTIRIPLETHKAIKQKCKQEGRFLSAYVDNILKEAIHREALDKYLAGAESKKSPAFEMVGDSSQGSHL